MAQAFSQIMFTPAVKTLQERFGSRESYRQFESAVAPPLNRLGESERQFIVARDSFYMASVSETGWPYVQHRGGAPGFLRVLDEQTIGFADYQGNRQYVSTGNLSCDNRVSIILMDYPNRRRLKLLGRARIINLEDDPDLIRSLEDPDYRARIERGFVIQIEAFDWNCPQHITPRFTQAEVDTVTAELRRQLEIAEADRERLLGTLGDQSGAPPASLGDGPLDLVVTGIRELADNVRGYEFRSADGMQLPPFDAGSHLAVPVRLANGQLSVRSYSLSSDPSCLNRYEIAVRRDDAGTGGSTAIHRDFTLGTRIRCQVPLQNFQLHDDERPAILIAGGIGITPIKSMAHHLVSNSRDVTLHYAARLGRLAYRDELEALLGDRVHFYGGKNRLDVSRLIASLPPQVVIYVCGPERLIATVQDAAQQSGLAEDQVRFERFSRPKPDSLAAFDLVLAKTGTRLHVAADESALDALERGGANVPSLCRAGTCGTCIVQLKQGVAQHCDQVLSVAQRAAGQFAPCVSRAQTPELILDL